MGQDVTQTNQINPVKPAVSAFLNVRLLEQLEASACVDLVRLYIISKQLA